MKITPEAIEAIARADEALAASESPALREVRKLAAQKLEEQRQAEYEAAQGISPSLAKVRALADAKIEQRRASARTDALPAPTFVIPRGAESSAMIRRETQHKLDQLTRRLVRARREGLDRVAEVKQEVADLKAAVASDDTFNALDVFERQRAIRKELKTARHSGNSARVAELEREAGFLYSQNKRLGSLRYVAIPPEESDKQCSS